MPEPITMATVAAVAEAGAAAGEGAAAAAGAAGTAEVGGHLAAVGEAARTASVGGTTEAFVGTLKMDAPAVGEMMLSRAESSGPALSEALNGAGTELPRVAKPLVEAGQGAGVFDAARWSEWRPPTGDVVNPSQIAERFRPLRDAPNLEAYVRNLEQRDGRFAQELARRQEQFGQAKTPAELDGALNTLSKSTAGKLGEAIAKDGWAPFFDKVEVQNVVTTDNGVTKVDLRLVGARQPMILGRGLSVEKGGNLSIEVKVGKPESLVNQLRHAANLQVLGHRALGDKSLVMVSQDVYAMVAERSARDAVAGSGSRVVALAPEKRMLDESLLRILRDRMEKA